MMRALDVAIRSVSFLAGVGWLLMGYDIVCCLLGQERRVLVFAAAWACLSVALGQFRRVATGRIS